MTWRRAALIAAMLTLGACADGGTRGTGIFTSVAGNVVSVNGADLAVGRDRSDVEDIQVWIEDSTAHSQTAADGSFSLRGDFEGMVTLVFAPPTSAGRAQIALNLPAGGTLTMHNVHVDTAQGTAIPDAADVEFDGVITATDCAGETLTMQSVHHAPGDVDLYIVRLERSSLENMQGAPVPCADVRIGEQASVQGAVNPDGTFGDATIVLQN